MLFPDEFDAAPVVHAVVTDVFKSCRCSHSENHRHILDIEAAYEKQTSFMQTECIGRDVLQEYVSVDVGKEHII